MHTEATLQQRIERVSLDWEDVARAQRRARVLRSRAFHALFHRMWTWVRGPVERAPAPADCEPIGACA